MTTVNTSQYAYIVEENLGLVYKVIKRFKVNNFDRDDLVQAGMMGLLRAAYTFDMARGLKFSTYAVPFIIGAIKKEFKKLHMVVSSKYYEEINRNISMNKPQDYNPEDVLVATNMQTPMIIAEELNNVGGEYLNINKYFLNQTELKMLEYRLKGNYSQSQIAKLMNVSQSKVSRTFQTIKETIKNS